jgi:hypothetical protein
MYNGFSFCYMKNHKNFHMKLDKYKLYINFCANINLFLFFFCEDKSIFVSKYKVDISLLYIYL